ncbi:FAD-dependent oxidoreductase [Paludisphaera mucosa]|uniref:FAD-dependent oxidoreductase n=1 Tax=Paludisphaera mucosa TaxID=3030827 RepID=A0ABT6F510_9BACT|nr:cyclic nucleotide-binding domain-containing thioredoxin-disulfide reductase [Paludisphaera mucosa]MDG3002612.1 FAD-dependent oxidoreductase [Paludisphaera mucosa]
MANVEEERYVAFPRLTEAEVAHLADLAELCTFEDGESVFQAGERGVSLYVVESGLIAIVDESAEESKTVVVHGPGEFTGDVSLLTDRPAVISAYARGATRAYCVGPAELRRVIQEIPDLSDKLLDAFQARRVLLERSGFVGVRVFGRLGDPDLTVIREFFDKNKVPHTWVDVEATDGRTAMEALGVAVDQLPFVSCNRGTRSPRPTVTRLAECLGLKRRIRTEPFDLVIVGAGPAGLAAAVYGASEGLSTILLDRFGPGGQAGTSSRIENYMGFPAGLAGSELANRGYLQALKFGAELVAPVEVRSMTRDGRMHLLELDDGQVVSGRTVLIATGASYQRLPIDGCERWDGGGIFYSCTSVHARSCREGRAAVVGGGNSAGQAAMYLADHTAGATLLLRGGDIRKSMSDYLARRIERHEKIEVLRHVEVDAIEGESSLRGVRLRDVREGGVRNLDCTAVFVFIGAQPRTEWLPPDIAVDSKGFIITGADAAQSAKWPLKDREPCVVETTSPGVFAAGDVRSNTTKRVAFAVGDGALAVTCAHRVLSDL